MEDGYSKYSNPFSHNLKQPNQKPQKLQLSDVNPLSFSHKTWAYPNGGPACLSTVGLFGGCCSLLQHISVVMETEFPSVFKFRTLLSVTVIYLVRYELVCEV